MTTLSRLGKDWASTDPVVVHGFVGRVQATRLLKSQKPGTFLLRISESQQGNVAISFAEKVSCGFVCVFFTK